ncbi:MAG: PAS domain S-box-containing protein [Thermoproteota archaeon]
MNVIYEYNQQIFKTLGVGVIIVNSFGKIQSMNDKAKAFFSCTNSDHKESVFQIIPIKKELLNIFLAATITEVVQEFQFSLNKQSFSVYLTRNELQQGESVFYIKYSNTTDGYRLKMERASLELTVFIDTANALIFGVDKKGNVNEWNKKAVEVTGFTRDEVMGNSLVAELIFQDCRESVSDVLERALLGKESSSYQFPLCTKDNNRVMLLLNTTIRRSADGDIVGVVGVGQNITELDCYRSEMEQAAQDLTILIDTANAPIFGIDKKGNVNEWNKKTAKITGFTSTEALGKNLVEEFISEECRESVSNVLQLALNGNETSNYELLLFTKDNRKVIVLLNATIRRDARGEIIGVIGVGQDITYQKKRENKIRILQEKLISSSYRDGVAENASSVLHNIGNILTTIIHNPLRGDCMDQLSISNNILSKLSRSFSSFKNEEEVIKFIKDDDRGRQFIPLLGEITKNLGHVEGVLDRYIKYVNDKCFHIAEVISSQQKFANFKNIRIEKVNLFEMVSNCHSMYQDRLQKSDIRVNFEISPSANIEIEKIGFAQVVTNIILNAIESIDERFEKDAYFNDKILTLSTKENEEYIILSFKDSGTGIEKNKLKEIFKYGFSTKSRGSGFGLHNCSNFMVRSSGKIEVASEGVNTGANIELFCAKKTRQG